MRPRTVLLLGLGALITPIAHIVTTTLLGGSWIYPTD